MKYILRNLIILLILMALPLSGLVFWQTYLFIVIAYILILIVLIIIFARKKVIRDYKAKRFLEAHMRDHDDLNSEQLED